MDESRSGDEGQAEAGDESGPVGPAEAEEPVDEPGPPRDDYVPV